MAEATSTFVLRLWTEAEARGQRRGRGRVEHLQTGDRCYFDDIAEALAFISEHFGGYDSLLRPESDSGRSVAVTSQEIKQ
jgi:hypothetical protein